MFGQCARCGLTVPKSLLVPVIAQTKQGAKNVHVCQACAKVIKTNQGQK